MRASLLCSAFCVFGLLSAGARAQSQAPARTVTTGSDASLPHSAGSSDLSRAATAGFSFNEPTPAPKKVEKPKETASEAEVAESEENDPDRPRNTIVRLPKYVVQGDRPPVFKEKEILTHKGLADVAVKRYLSQVGQTLNLVHLPGILGGMSNGDLALQKYREDERLRNVQDLNEQSELFRAAGDIKGADEIKADTQSTYMRRSEFDTTPNSLDGQR